MAKPPATPGSPAPPSDAEVAERSGPDLRDPAIRVVMMPRDTNPQGTIFGGVILSLIDQAAFVHALRVGSHRYVTVAFDTVEFHKPVRVGDVVSLCCETERLGRTSVRVHAVVWSERQDRPDPIKVTEATVTLVAIDAEGAPIPIQRRS
jgi:acyl-CoA thioesterase YciA